MTFFESPHRIAQTLKAAAGILGARPIMLARELTKMHQQFLRGTASALADRVQDTQKGEFTVVVGPMTNFAVTTPAPSDQAIADEFGVMANDSGLSRREAVLAAAKRLGLSARDVYAAIERSKK
jgi:16S rRNA (cytidine1402-2'-O)-methyltransferase